MRTSCACGDHCCRILCLWSLLHFLLLRLRGSGVREEGLAGLWRGLGPNVARNAIINAAGVARICGRCSENCDLESGDLCSVNPKTKDFAAGVARTVTLKVEISAQ